MKRKYLATVGSYEVNEWRRDVMSADGSRRKFGCGRKAGGASFSAVYGDDDSVLVLLQSSGFLNVTELRSKASSCSITLSPISSNTRTLLYLLSLDEDHLRCNEGHQSDNAKKIFTPKETAAEWWSETQPQSTKINSFVR